MPTDDQVKSVLESVTKTKDQEIAELLEVNQQLDRDCTKLALRNAQLVIEIEQLKEQFDLVLVERNEAMDEKASADRMRATVVENLASMSEFAGKAVRERDRARAGRDEARRWVCELQCDPPERFIGLPHELARLKGWDCFKEDIMNTEHDWTVWWNNEGSGMRPKCGQDHESHVRDMTRIAWLNGAFVAADEIERLRAELSDAWRKSSQALVELSSNLCATSARERERIVAERDEARREVCSLTANWKHERFDVAKTRGWDCYKENTNE